MRICPGSEAETGGVRPGRCKPYDHRAPLDQRLNEAVGWLRDGGGSFLSLYLEEVHGVGHRAGPESAELATAIKLNDARIGQQVARLAAGHITANRVIVSEHGMTRAASNNSWCSTSCTRPCDRPDRWSRRSPAHPGRARPLKLFPGWRVITATQPSAMKLASLLSRVAAVGFAAFLATVALNAAPLISFSLAAGAFLALIAAHDYAPRHYPRVSVAATVLRFPPPAHATESHRLAA
ncbi:MAG: alkaline phosphatase family protein [Verrucomicrobia bacterium]|nr:alkaline phosphatase family protein [Verrucomicrobiota bacterium]